MNLDFSSVNPSEVNPETGLDFSTVGTPSPYIGSFTSKVDPTKYMPYTDSEVRPEMGLDYLNAARAQGQGPIEQFGSFLTQAVVGEIVGGTLEGLGYLAEIGSAADMATGEELNFGNGLSRLGQDMRTWSQEVAPIYETAPGEFAPGKWSWWMSNGVSVASTLSLLIPAMGTVRAVSMAGKAAGMANTIGKVGKAAGLSAKGIALLEATAPGVSQAIVSRHMESMMEASGKWEEIYKRNISLGLSDIEARQNAGVAASDIYNKNWVMLLQDIPQYLLLGKSFGNASKALTPGLLKALGKPAGMASAKSIGKYAFVAASEGGEEAYQYIVSELADDLSRAKIDPSYVSREIPELTNDSEFWTSVSMGAIGGGVFQAAGRAFNKKFGVDEDKKRINNVKTHGPLLKLYSSIMKEAEASGDIASYEEARLGLVNSLATKAAELGNINAAVVYLENMMEQEATPEAAAQLGLETEDIEYIKKNFPALIEQVKEVGDIYEHYTKGKDNNTVYDPDIASTLAGLDSSKRRLNTRRGELEKEFSQSVDNLNKAGYNRLSAIGQKLIINDAAIIANKKVKKLLESRLVSDKISGETATFYTKKLEAVNKKLSDLQNKNKELKASDEYTKENKANDRDISIDPALLADLSSKQSSIEYTDLAISKKDDAIAFTKEQQKKRKNGTASVPQEPEIPVEQEVENKEPVASTVHEATSSSPEITENVETKDYIPNPNDIKSRRAALQNQNKIFELLKEYGGNTLSEIFDIYESVSVIKGTRSNTGILKKEGDSLYFYSDNLSQKLDVTNLIEDVLSETGIIFITDPIKYKVLDPSLNQEETTDASLSEEELQATSNLTPDAEHPSSDLEKEASSNVKDTTILKGESKVFYGFDKQTDLTDYLNNSENDITNAIGEFSIDYENETFNPSKKDLKYLKEGNLTKLSQDFIDSIPISISLTNEEKQIPGKLYLPKGTTVPKNAEASDNYKETNRALRTNILQGIAKGNKVTVTGFRKDSGSSWNIPNRGDHNNIIKSLNLAIEDIHLGVAMKEGAVYDKLNNALPVFGNINGGNVYLATDKTPNKELRAPKLNKTKVSDIHANIILNAFQQSTKGWKQVYQGAEVTAKINLGSLLSLLVVNGKNTIVTDSRKELIQDAEYLERLLSKQLYKTGRILRYGKEGRINLNNISVEDRRNFVEYAKANFNYSINLARFGDKLSERFPTPVQIGSWNITQEDIDTNLTFEQHYVKNGWVTTDLIADKQGNVLKMPGVYLNNSTLTVEEVSKESTETAETSPTDIESVPSYELEITRKGVNGEFVEDLEFIAEGSESYVYRKDNKIIKISEPYNDKSVETFNTRVEEALKIDKLIGTGTLRLVGTYQSKNGTINPIFEQEALTPTEATEEDIKDLMFSKGFEQIEYNTYKGVINGIEYTFGDIDSENVMERDGELVVIDASIISETPVKVEDKSIDDILNPFRPFSSKYYEGKLFVRVNIEQQLEEIKSILGDNVSVDVVQDLIRVVDETGGHVAFGQVKNGSITLYERAEEGTGYHEAFHIVSLYYLTGAQRSKIYDSAAQHYNIDRNNERDIEEALAEGFREYMISDKKVAPKTKVVRTFFQKLYDFVVDLFVSPRSKLSDLTIEKLFNNIENGTYKEAKIRNKNLKKYSGYDYLRKIEGFSTEQTHHITDLLMYQMLTKNNIVSLEDINKLSLDPVIKYVKDLTATVDKHRKIEGISQENKEELDRLYNVYTKILTNFPEFSSLITDKLYALNINRQTDSFEDTMGIDTHNLFVDSQSGKELTKFDRATYESSSKDNLLANIKLFIATLPASGEIDPFTRMPKIVDFAESYSKIMIDLHKAVTFDEIIKILEQKASDDLYYKVLLEGDPKSNRVGLKNAPLSFQNQFEIAVDKHRHSFKNVIRDEQTGEHLFVDAAISKVERELAYEWSLNFFLTGKYINLDDTINQDALALIINKFNQKVKIPVNQDYARGSVLTKYDTHLENTIDVLSDIGIYLTKEDIQNVINSLGKDNKDGLNRNIGFQKLVNEVLFGLFGSKGVLTTLSELDLNKYQKPEEALAKDNKTIQLAKLVIDGNVYMNTDTVLGAENNTYYVYAQPSLLTTYVKNLKKDSELTKGLRTVTFNKNSRFLAQIEEGANFNIATLSSYRNGKKAKDYISIDPKDDFLLKMDAVQKNLLPFPTLADRSSYYFYEGLNKISLEDSYISNNKYYLSDVVVDIFYNYAKDEQSRIAKVRKEINDAKSNKDYSILVQNKHYNNIKADGTPIFSEDVNGLKFHHFNNFNTYNNKGDFIGTRDLDKNEIRNSLRKNALNTLEYAESLNLVQLQKDKQGHLTSIKNKGLNSTSVKKYSEKFGNETLGIFHLLSDYTLNTISSTIETEKLITMDPAYYKGVEDKIKRLTAPASPGDKLIIDFKEGILKGKTTYKTGIVRSFIYNDKKLILKLHADLTRAYKKQYPEASREEVRKAVDLRTAPYENTDVTDGQAMVTIEAYKELKMRMGEWESSHQEAYEILTSDTTEKDKLLKAQTLIMQPLKLIHFGPYFNNNAGIPIYDKMSVAVLLPSVVKGTSLEPLYNHMQSEGIEMLKYHTAVKAGNIGMIDYFKKNGDILEDNLKNLRTYNQSFKYLRKQQVTDPHVTEERMLGTQVRKVVMANLKLDSSIYSIKGSNKKFTGREIGDMYVKAYSSLSNEGRKVIEKALDISKEGKVNKERLYDSLRRDAQQGNMPYNIIDPLYTKEDGTPNIQLDTLLNRNWTESRMISTIAKKTVDLYTTGTDLIQMSGGGLTKLEDENLKLVDDKGRSEIKISVTMFKSVIPDYDNKTFSEKTKWLKSNINAGYEGIGYRIPTQGQNSVIPFVIKEFLPEAYGNTIILPYSFTTLTGSDFDIDKLFITRYNYYYIGDKIYRHTFHDGNEGGKITDEETLRQIYKEYTLPKLNLRDNLLGVKERIDRSVDKKAALLNAWNIELDTNIKVQVAEEVGIDNITQDVLDRLGFDMTYNNFNDLLSTLLELPTIEEFIKENKGKDAFDINHKKAIQNRLLDLMFSVLTNEEHVLETKTPIDTFTDKLKVMAKQIKGKKSFEMMEAASPTYQLQVKNWYIGGKKGIGPFALNNVHHSLTQLTEYAFIGESEMTYDMSQMIGKDGIFIIDWLSALINAHVDIAKDPYIFHLNVHKDTYNIVNLLIRAGYGEQTFWLINQEAVKAGFDNDHFLDEARKKATEVSQTKEELDIRLSEIKDISNQYSNPEIVLADKDLSKYVNVKNKDYIYYAKQAGIVDSYTILNNDSKYLSKIVLASRIDNKGFGKTLGDLRSFNTDLESLMSIDPNFSDLITETHLKTLYDNSVSFIKDLYSDLLIDSTSGFEALSDSLRSKFDVKREVINKALYSSIIALYFTSKQGFNLTKNDISKLMKGETSLGYRLRNLATHPELKNNKFVNTLKPVLDRETGIWFIKSLSGDKNDKNLRDTYSDGWGDLLEHTDKEIRRIGEDLVYYSFYTSGFNRSLYTFYQDVPIEFFTKRPAHLDTELTKSFDDFVKDTLSILNNEMLPDEFVEQVMNNATKILELNEIEDYKGPATAINGSDGNVALYKLDPMSSGFLGYNVDGAPIYKQLYMYNDPQRGQSLLEYVGYQSVSKTILYKVKTETGRNYKGHKLLELGYEGSILEGERNTVSEDTLRDKLNTIEGFKDFVYISPENREMITTEQKFITRGKTLFGDIINIHAGAKENASLSNISIRPFTYLGGEFNSVEQAFQEAKLQATEGTDADIRIHARISTSDNLFEIKKLGSQYPTLDTKKWRKISSQLMEKFIGESFVQNPEALKELLATKDSTLTHEGPGVTGTYWAKEFPKILMKVRDNLAKNNKSTLRKGSSNSVEENTESPFLSETQTDLITQIPTGFAALERLDELHNAAINMEAEEFKSIVEQIRNCYGG